MKTTSAIMLLLQMVLASRNYYISALSFANHYRVGHGCVFCDATRSSSTSTTIRYFNHKLQLNGAMDGYSYDDNDSKEEETNYRPTTHNTNTRTSSSSAGRGGGYDNEYNNNDDDRYTLERHSDPNTLPDCRFTEEQIRLLIAKRLECKKRRNFADADKILEALNTNGIFLQDKARKYRVDGANHFGRKPPYVRRGSTYGTSAEDLAGIAKLVEERFRHKLKREYHASDGITDKLKNRYGVRVNDKKREWSVVPDGNNGSGNKGDANGNGASISSHKNEGPDLGASEKSKSNNNNNQDHYIPTPLAPDDHATHTMSDQLKDLIRDKLRDRSTARKNKKYKEADRIRDKLINEYSILIDDKNKEWKVVDYDNIDDNLDEYDPFVNEARLSQRSAFVQKGAGEQGEGRENENMHAHNYNDNHSYVDRSSSNNDDGDLADALLSSSSRTVLDREDENEMGNTNTTDDDDETAAAGESGSSDRRPLLAALTVPLLKDKLRAEGLRLGGNKAELIDRLLAAGIIE